MTEFYPIEAPKGLLNLPRRPRIGPVAVMGDEFACFEKHLSKIAEKVAAYRPKMTMGLWRWVQQNCEGCVTTSLGIEIGERHAVWRRQHYRHGAVQ